MKKLMFLFLLPFSVYSQTLKDVGLSTLVSPSSPGFTILGVQPKDVSRPKDFNSFELSLLNAVSNNNTYTLPANFAVETTPYWLKHRSITFDDLEKQAGADKVFTRTFSLSIATAQRTNQVDTTIKISQLGIGFRALLSQGELADPLGIQNINTENQLIEETANFYGLIIDGAAAFIENNIGSKSSYTPDEINDLLKYPFSTLAADPTASAQLGSTFTRIETKQKYKDYIKILYNNLIRVETKRVDFSDSQDWIDFLYGMEEKIIPVLRENTDWEKGVSRLRDLRQNRVGLIWELAGATALESANAKYKSLSANRYGIWTTITYRPKFDKNQKLKQKLDFSLMIRYLYENTELLRGSNLDFGFRPVFDNNKFILSGEILQRTTWRVLDISMTPPPTKKTIEMMDGFRWGGTLGYRINPNILIEFNAGKTFDNDAINSGGFLTVLGANFGFGKPVVNLK